MMKPTLSILITILVLLAAGATSFAAAATLGVTSKTLGAGRTAVPACDTDGFTFTHTLTTSHDVATVTVSGIALACAGATLQLTLANAVNTSIGSSSAVLPAAGFTGAATMAIAGVAPSASVAAYRVAIS
jgi:hypothetical protein